MAVPKCLTQYQIRVIFHQSVIVPLLCTRRMHFRGFAEYWDWAQCYSIYNCWMCREEAMSAIHPERQTPGTTIIRDNSLHLPLCPKSKYFDCFPLLIRIKVLMPMLTLIAAVQLLFSIPTHAVSRETRAVRLLIIIIIIIINHDFFSVNSKIAVI